jgi:hypothetical protein
MANTAGHPAGTAGGREVLAFDRYGTLVDPIAIAGELGRLLGDAAGREAAGMRTAWVNRSAVPFDTIGAVPDLTVPALDRLPAVLGG